MALDKAFSIKDIGDLKYFLGLEIARSNKGISVCQKKYVTDLLKDYGLSDAKPVSTPMEYTSKLSRSIAPPYDDISAYRRLVGRLVYLTTTRPDICYAVGKLSQCLDFPTTAHYQAAICVLKYLKNVPATGLLFPTSSDLYLKGFTDADWASCPDTRRSISGYCFFLGDALVSWKSKKQPTVARSSSEAEYRAMAAGVYEVQWLSYLLHDLNIPITQPILFYCDNQSALYIVANPVFHERTKHIEVDCHVVRERAVSRLIKLLPISSKNQTADIFTKALAPGPFQNCFSKLGLFDLYAPQLRGNSTSDFIT
ncbi:uncharacterized mitochondrial protein AtMg00810-like [Arachis stenosperma]|uniref:uncharacterized mitochondrial protein AtMg00810-like n=1 Tax=Arachis stenosperma TaxID=217475 RepID=UPI0025AC64AB|nr:uncharacterized mitochondrial protein AtMg00810-like [Arachis stenosperma]